MLTDARVQSSACKKRCDCRCFSGFWKYCGLLLACGTLLAFNHAHNTTRLRREMKTESVAVNKPTECPQRLGRVFRLARPSPGISGGHTNKGAGSGDPRTAEAGPKWTRIESRSFSNNLTNQPNAHYGLGALSAWERPSQGIFSFTRPKPTDRNKLLLVRGRETRAQLDFGVKPEGCPNGLGGVSAKSAQAGASLGLDARCWTRCWMLDAGY
jgi:hypothetical protein